MSVAIVSASLQFGSMKQVTMGYTKNKIDVNERRRQGCATKKNHFSDLQRGRYQLKKSYINGKKRERHAHHVEDGTLNRTYKIERGKSQMQKDSINEKRRNRYATQVDDGTGTLKGKYQVKKDSINQKKRNRYATQVDDGTGTLKGKYQVKKDWSWGFLNRQREVLLHSGRKVAL